MMQFCYHMPPCPVLEMIIDAVLLGAVSDDPLNIVCRCLHLSDMYETCNLKQQVPSICGRSSLNPCADFFHSLLT